MKRRLTIEQTNKGRITLLIVTGFMDMNDVEYFEQQLDQLIAAGKTQLVLDLDALEYISSSGLGAIVARLYDIREKKGDIKIGGCSPRVREIFNVLGFTRIIDVCEDSAQAMKLF